MKTLPTGSQIFWSSIALSVYIAMWIYAYNLENNVDRIHSIVLLSATSTAFFFIHFLEYFTNQHTNILHYLNPLILLKVFVFCLAEQIQKFNKFLDKLFD